MQRHWHKCELRIGKDISLVGRKYSTSMIWSIWHSCSAISSLFKPSMQYDSLSSTGGPEPGPKTESLLLLFHLLWNCFGTQRTWTFLPGPSTTSQSSMYYEHRHEYSTSFVITHCLFTITNACSPLKTTTLQITHILHVWYISLPLT